MRPIRLMNVAQVRVGFPGAEFDLRPSCVEITPTPDITVVLMFSLWPLENNVPGRSVDPRIVGRLTLAPEATLIDPLEGDGACWYLRAGDVELMLRPYQDEAIWIDPSFGEPADARPGSLASLRHQYRASQVSCIAHRRMLNQSREGSALHTAHLRSVQIMEETVSRLRKLLGYREVRANGG